MTLTDVFNINLFASKIGLSAGMAVRLFGVDFAFILTFDPRAWSLISVDLMSPRTKVLGFMTILFATFYIGRNPVLYD